MDQELNNSGLSREEINKMLSGAEANDRKADNIFKDLPDAPSAPINGAG